MKKQRVTINKVLTLSTVILLLLANTSQINASKFGVTVSDTAVKKGDTVTLTASIADKNGMIQVKPKVSKNLKIISEVSPSGTLVSTDGKDVVIKFKVSGPGEISLTGLALDVDFKEYKVDESFSINIKVPSTEIEDNATTTIPSTEIEDNATTNPSTEKEDKASAAVKVAEASKTQKDIEAAKTLVNALKESKTKTALQARLNAIIIEETPVSDYETALTALRKADLSRDSRDIALAQDLADSMINGWQKNRLLNRLEVITGQQDASANHDKALSALRTADASRNANEIEIARKLINKLDDGWQKNRLVNRLVVIDAQEALRP